MKNLILILITLAATATPTANAGTKAFGAELNVTTIDTLSDIAEVKEVGTNPVTNGKVFETKSNQFGVEGFIKVTEYSSEKGHLELFQRNHLLLFESNHANYLKLSIK